MSGLSKFRRLACLALFLPAVCVHAAPNVGPSGAAEMLFVSLVSDPKAASDLEALSQRNNPYATFYLGVAQEQGRGMPKDLTTALDSYRAVSDKIKEAAFNAGRIYYATARFDEAVGYLVLAAGAEKADGLSKAMVLLGRIYESGSLSFGSNYLAALRWYDAAARRRDAFSTGKMGEFLLFGKGRAVNYHEAKIYLERAADMGNRDSQVLLGEMFQKGTGVQASRTEAAKWFYIAGHPFDGDRKHIVDFLSTLSAAESDAARRMAGLWRAAHVTSAPIESVNAIERLQ